jgi:hypothetical protein
MPIVTSVYADGLFLDFVYAASVLRGAAFGADPASQARIARVTASCSSPRLVLSLPCDVPLLIALPGRSCRRVLRTMSGLSTTGHGAHGLDTMAPR